MLQQIWCKFWFWSWAACKVQKEFQRQTKASTEQCSVNIEHQGFSYHLIFFTVYDFLCRFWLTLRSYPHCFNRKRSKLCIFWINIFLLNNKKTQLSWNETILSLKKNWKSFDQKRLLLHIKKIGRAFFFK